MVLVNRKWFTTFPHQTWGGPSNQPKTGGEICPMSFGQTGDDPEIPHVLVHIVSLPRFLGSRGFSIKCRLPKHRNFMKIERKNDDKPSETLINGDKL